MNSDPPPAAGGAAGGYGGGPAAWRAERSTTIIVAAVIFLVVLVTVGAIVQALGPAGPGGDTRDISVSAGSVATVDLHSVPGQLVIVGTSGGQVRLTGQLHWTGRPPSGTASTDAVASVLHLSYRCAAGSPCTEDYRLAVPPHTAVVLDQPAGHVAVAGLAGSLRITGASVDISATGLRSPALTATITSGHLTAAFAAAPRKVDVTLNSAQATLRLPTGTSYAVSQEVTSGSVNVGVPQASDAARTVTARVVSSDLELLPLGPAS